MDALPVTGAEVVDRARSLLEQRSAFVTPGSRKEYLFLLLSNAMAALERGDYAIGAVAALRHRDIEVISLGANSLFSQNDPRGHAEANALGRLLALGRPKSLDNTTRLKPWPGLPALRGIASGLYLRRPGDVEDAATSILYTSLEPCPMCTVTTLNAGVERVWVAGRDPWAGALSEDGVHDMPPLWAEIQKGQGMRVEYFETEANPDQEMQQAAALVGELFIATKEPLDRELSGGGLLSLGRVERAVDALDSHSVGH